MGVVEINTDRGNGSNEMVNHDFDCRFDLIFLMLDPQDELYDRRLATHLVSLYHQTQEEEEEEYLVCLIRIP